MSEEKSFMSTCSVGKESGKGRKIRLYAVGLRKKEEMPFSVQHSFFYHKETWNKQALLAKENPPLTTFLVEIPSPLNFFFPGSILPSSPKYKFKTLLH